MSQQSLIKEKRFCVGIDNLMSRQSCLKLRRDRVCVT